MTCINNTCINKHIANSELNFNFSLSQRIKNFLPDKKAV